MDRCWWGGPSARPGPSSFFFMGCGPARPISFLFDPWAAARPGPPNFHRMDHGPARPSIYFEDGRRPGPAHQIFRGRAAARPGPSIFQICGPGSARPMTSAARPMRHGLHMVGRPVELKSRPVGRPMGRPTG